MNRAILDASVLLALLYGEPGTERLTAQSGLLENAAMSTVNLAEAHSKLVNEGIDPDDAWKAVTGPIPEIVAFDADQAAITGQLVRKTRALGLSLGDRACLALGITLKAPIYTADRAWRNLRVGVAIHVVR